MRFSEDRVSHIAHLITDGIWKDDLVDFVDEDKVLQETKRSIASYLKIEDGARSEEHTSELQSRLHLVCRFFNETATTEIYTLSLHDALPISLWILWMRIRSCRKQKGVSQVI